jgi:geranylgeranyl diphosphate synthase, type I
MKNFGAFMQGCLPKIEAAINEQLRPQKPAELEDFFLQPVSTMLRDGGKRLRPVLACLTHDSLGGREKSIFQLAAIPELIHNGTLIVDDIEDHSLLRRGKPCVYVTHGIELAVNAGNLLYCWPLLQLEKSDLPVERRLAILLIANHELAKVQIGQGMDILWSQQQNFAVSPAKYLEMAANKTSALISMALRIGAVAAGAGEKTLKLLEELAVDIGLAYQIRDDVLNLQSTGGLGKTFGEDITEGKLTWLIAYFMNQATASDRAKLTKILRAKTTDQKKIVAAIDLLKKYEVFVAAVKEVTRYQKAAREKIERLKFKKKFSTMWYEFVDYLGEREK